MLANQPNPERVASPETRVLPAADSKGRDSRSPERAASKGPEVVMVEGDLLKQEVDAIVNAWNRNLIPYWLLVTQGVSGAIKKAGGTSPFRELRNFGTLPLGAARLTSAGRLPFKGIIHVAGINHVWRSSEWSVRQSVKSALTIARNEGFSAVALPAIGAGSSLSIGGREFAIWGVSSKRSLEIIKEEAMRSDYQGKVVIVKFKRTQGLGRSGKPGKHHDLLTFE